MRAGGGDNDRDEDHHRSHHSVVGVPDGVELSDFVGGVRPQQEAEGEQIDRKAADPREEITVTEQRRTLVVAGAEFGGEGGTGHLIEGDDAADQDRHAQQIVEQRMVVPMRWVPQQHIADCKRQSRGVHQRVTAAPSGSKIVGELPDHRIDHGVENERDHQAPGPRAWLAGRSPGYRTAAAYS